MKWNGDLMNIKQQAVLAVAKAFYNRGAYIQYDQRSMDRVLQLTPRRRKYLPPEAANSQYTQFLDCSGYVSAIYLQAFGYELPSDLTWLMIDQIKPRVFYYEFTHEETVQELLKLREEVCALLQPGDLITYDRGTDNGHVVMYLGADQYTDCNIPTGQKDSYDYIECKNNFYDHGGIWIHDLDVILPKKEENLRTGRSIFREKTRRFSINRPLDLLDKPLPQALARINQANGLWCAVESSVYGCQQAYSGKTIDYTVIIRNELGSSQDVQITFISPTGTSILGKSAINLLLQGGEEKRITFSVVVQASREMVLLKGPIVTVNHLIVYAHPILLGRTMSAEQWETIKTATLSAITKGETALKAASVAYSAFGIHLNPEGRQYSVSHFSVHDSTKGAVLSRRPQRPFFDMTVYAAFGGKAVITPEMASKQGVRITHITSEDLLPGDLLLCLDDAFGERSYSSFYDGEHLIGQFEAGTDIRVIQNEELDCFVDSLFGRYAFLLLRPWQAYGTP